MEVSSGPIGGWPTPALVSCRPWNLDTGQCFPELVCLEVHRGAQLSGSARKCPPPLPGTLPSSFLLVSNSPPKHHSNIPHTFRGCSLQPCRPLPSPHVADIASIREGAGQQACRDSRWPSMASPSRAPCPAQWAGMRSSAPALNSPQLLTNCSNSHDISAGMPTTRSPLLSPLSSRPPRPSLLPRRRLLPRLRPLLLLPSPPSRSH